MASNNDVQDCELVQKVNGYRKAFDTYFSAISNAAAPPVTVLNDALAIMKTASDDLNKAVTTYLKQTNNSQLAVSTQINNLGKAASTLNLLISVNKDLRTIPTNLDGK